MDKCIIINCISVIYVIYKIFYLIDQRRIILMLFKIYEDIKSVFNLYTRQSLPQINFSGLYSFFIDILIFLLDK